MTARAPDLDPVLAAIDGAPRDERSLEAEELEALDEARAQSPSGRAMSPAEVEAWIAARERAEDG